MCPNDPLLFTCTATDTSAASARVTLPTGVSVVVTNTNMTEIVGAASLPDGVDIQLSSGMTDGGSGNYRITLAIERASLLGGNDVSCVALTVSPLTPPDLESCPLATGTTVIVPRAHLYI